MGKLLDQYTNSFITNIVNIQLRSASNKDKPIHGKLSLLPPEKDQGSSCTAANQCKYTNALCNNGFCGCQRTDYEDNFACLASRLLLYNYVCFHEKSFKVILISYLFFSSKLLSFLLVDQINLVFLCKKCSCYESAEILLLPFECLLCIYRKEMLTARTCYYCLLQRKLLDHLV